MEELAEQISAAVVRSLSLLRIQQGLTHHELADRTGLNRSYIGLLEKGKRRPTLEVALRLALALNQNLSEILAKVETTPDIGTTGRKSQDGKPSAHLKIGRVLRRYRLKAGLTQEQLAERSGLNAIILSQIERDRISLTLDEAHAICRSLGIKLTDLLATIE